MITKTTTTATTGATRLPITTNFEVKIAKQDFKFNAAHFVAFKGFRERLHGHNYQVGVRLLGSHHICSDGYVLDYGDVKKSTRRICKSLNEIFLCPTLSDVITITIKDREGHGKIVQLDCEDGSQFVIPRQDCLMLPIVHGTTEELAIYIWGELVKDLGATMLLERGIHTVEVTVSEAVGQEAVFRLEVPTEAEENTQNMDVASYILDSRLPPSNCSYANETDQNLIHKFQETNASKLNKTNESNACSPGCPSHFEKQLKILANAISNGDFLSDSKSAKQVSVADLQAILNAKKDDPI